MKLRRLLSAMLSCIVTLFIMSPTVQARATSINTTAYIDNSGDLIINHNGMDIRVTTQENSNGDSIVCEYHDNILYQEVTRKASAPNVMIIQDFTSDGFRSDNRYEEVISYNTVTYSFSNSTPKAGKEYVGTLSGRALSINNPDNDFDFSVRVWNEITRSDQTSYTLPDEGKTAAAWASLLASAVAFAFPVLGIGSQTVANLISGGTLIYGAGSLLFPSLSQTVVSCNYSDNLVTMTPASNDPIYHGRT